MHFPDADPVLWTLHELKAREVETRSRFKDALLNKGDPMHRSRDNALKALYKLANPPTVLARLIAARRARAGRE